MHMVASLSPGQDFSGEQFAEVAPDMPLDSVAPFFS